MRYAFLVVFFILFFDKFHVGKETVMREKLRYTVREEFFGALVYDRMEDSYLAFDEDLLIAMKEDVQNIQKDPDLYEMLESEGFIQNGQKNYVIYTNSHEGENLSSPARIHFYYTGKCNLNCIHCFTKKDNIGTEMSLEQKKNMVCQMQALGINEILIGGGEPFAKKDFVEFAEYCLEKDISTKIFTNGLLLDEEMCKRMGNWNLTYLSISVDGTTDDEYEKIRGVRGITTLKRNIAYLKKYSSFPVAISVTVGVDNYNNASKYLKFAEECHVDRIKIRPTKPAGNVLDNPEIYLSPDKYLKFIVSMQKEWNKSYCGKFRIDFSWGDSRLYYDAEDNCMKVADIIFPYEGYGCFAGKASMVINAAGAVSPCGFLPSKMQYTIEDNITSKSIKEIWDTGKKFHGLRHQKGNEKCENCMYFGTCRGGCIARILYSGKSMNAVDPWCLAEFFPAKLEEKK